MTNYNRLQKKEYTIGFETALKNTENLFESAKILGVNAQYSFAVSLLIISCEELAKTFMLRIKQVDNKIDVININGFFKDHKIKHQLTINLYLLAYQKAIDAQDYTEEEIKKFQMIIAIIIGIIAYFTIKKEIDWSNVNLEKLRQKGLYVEYVSKDSKWNSPSNAIKKEEYEYAIELTQQVFEYVKENYFSITPKSSELKEFLKQWNEFNINNLL